MRRYGRLAMICACVAAACAVDPAEPLRGRRFAYPDDGDAGSALGIAPTLAGRVARIWLEHAPGCADEACTFVRDAIVHLEATPATVEFAPLDGRDPPTRSCSPDGQFRFVPELPGSYRVATIGSDGAAIETYEVDVIDFAYVIFLVDEDDEPLPCSSR